VAERTEQEMCSQKGKGWLTVENGNGRLLSSILDFCCLWGLGQA